MDTAFYPRISRDHHHHHGTTMKKDMNLNLDQHQNQNPSLKPADSLLPPSPDLGLLKLASPDLERLIIQSSNGMVTMTTTPTSSQQSHFLYPKSASDEQEFAEGFVKALEDLHKQNQLQSEEGGGAHVHAPDRLVDMSIGGSNVNAGGPVVGLPSDLPVYTTLNGYGASPLGGGTVNYSTDTVPFPPPPPPAAHLLTAHAPATGGRAIASPSAEDEPQTVPDMMHGFGGGDNSPPLSPIDMDNQERIKAERKKLRNRIAASKCRKRKLERISRLEDKVKNLKTQNSELSSTAGVLREQVAQLKQKVMNHVSNGCQQIPSQVQAY